MLRLTPTLRQLHIESGICPAAPTPVPLPHLESVYLGRLFEGGLDISAGFLFAHSVLNSQPHIRRLRLYLEKLQYAKTPMEAVRVVRRTEELVAAALTRNLRELTIVEGLEPLAELMQMPGVQYGWLKVHNESST